MTKTKVDSSVALSASFAANSASCPSTGSGFFVARATWKKD